MEPMLPQLARAEMAEISVRIIAKSGELKASLPSKIVRAEVAKQVREMNSYYSNLIEGHKTLPRDIERALKGGFAEDVAVRHNQQLSLAHIMAEKAMRLRLIQEPELNVYSEVFVRWLHQKFYSHVPADLWFTTSKSGKRYPLIPGEFRDYNVDVGKHVPPDFPVLDRFFARFDSVYSSDRILATERLIAIAAAHHRFAWIHPFGDGNGRVARLQSQAALIRCGLDDEGLWTLSRGLARSRANYYSYLEAADESRMGDLDGRGNLSDRMLAKFCIFFMNQILDQIEFMISLIEPSSLQSRIHNYLRYNRVDIEPKLREHLVNLLDVLCIKGEIARGEVSGIVGLKSTAARAVIRSALKADLVSSPNEKGALRINFPADTIEAYFPRLFTDLPVDKN
jgi:Fic family protein